MKKHEIFTFTAPNGVEVAAVVIYRRNLNRNFPNYVQYEYVAYAQNQLFTCTQMERVVDRENYSPCPIEYGHILVDYCIMPDYDSMLEAEQQKFDDDCYEALNSIDDTEF